MVLVNCKIERDLSWLKNGIISVILRTPEAAANPDANLAIAHAPATATISSNNTKLYVPVVI